MFVKDCCNDLFVFVFCRCYEVEISCVGVVSFDVVGVVIRV